MNLSCFLKSYLELTPGVNNCHTACAKLDSPRQDAGLQTAFSAGQASEGEMCGTTGVNESHFVGYVTSEQDRDEKTVQTVVLCLYSRP